MQYIDSDYIDEFALALALDAEPPLITTIDSGFLKVPCRSITGEVEHVPTWEKFDHSHMVITSKW